MDDNTRPNQSLNETTEMASGSAAPEGPHNHHHALFNRFQAQWLSKLTERVEKLEEAATRPADPPAPVVGARVKSVPDGFRQSAED